MAITVNINEFFDRLDLPNLVDVPAEHRYTVDEIGTIIGISDAPIVLKAVKLKEIFIANPLNREWVTIIKCVSASGKALPPFIIFSGKHT